MSTTTVPFSSPQPDRVPIPSGEGSIPWSDLTPEEVGTVFPKLLASKELQTHQWLHSQAADAPSVTAGPQAPGDCLVLLGGAPTDLLASLFACYRHGVPRVVEVSDGAAERRLRGVIGTLSKAGVAASVHQLVAGGLLVTVAQKLLASRQSIGAKLDLHCFGTARTDLLLFGEGPARAVITVQAARVGTVLSEAHTNGVAATVVGSVSSDPVFVVSTRRLLAQWTLAELREFINP